MMHPSCAPTWAGRTDTTRATWTAADRGCAVALVTPAAAATVAAAATAAVTSHVRGGRVPTDIAGMAIRGVSASRRGTT